jgi:hypothetical protein
MARSDDVEDWIPASFDDDFNPAAHGWFVEEVSAVAQNAARSSLTQMTEFHLFP